MVALPFSFRQLIEKVSEQYDSLAREYAIVKVNNEKLNRMLELTQAESVKIDKEYGFIIMELKFNTVFERPIEFALLNYRYVDDYGSEYFNEKSELTHHAAQGFDGKVEVIMTDLFQNENEFIYISGKKKAVEVLREQYGVEPSATIEKKDYLKEGLEVTVLGLVFKNHTEVYYRPIDERYF